MKFDRNHMAAGLFTELMATASGLGKLPAEERKEVYTQVTDFSFEMADAFIERAKELETPA